MSRIDQHDRIAAARFVDGEMQPEERAAFAARVESDPALAEAVAEVEACRALFRRARTEQPVPLRAGFADRVVQRARDEERVRSAELERRIVRMARICVAAAAAVILAAVLFVTGVIRMPDAGVLQADATAEMIRELDERIQAAEAPPRTLGR